MDRGGARRERRHAALSAASVLLAHHPARLGSPVRGPTSSGLRSERAGVGKSVRAIHLRERIGRQRFPSGLVEARRADSLRQGLVPRLAVPVVSLLFACLLVEIVSGKERRVHPVMAPGSGHDQLAELFPRLALAGQEGLARWDKARVLPDARAAARAVTIAVARASRAVACLQWHFITATTALPNALVIALEHLAWFFVFDTHPVSSLAHDVVPASLQSKC